MISASDIHHGKVLIVDDKKANVRLLEGMLRGAGYDSVTSTMIPGGVCGLHRRNRDDLILLDLQMPGVDGFQVMEGLTEIETGGYLPVLVIAAKPDHKLRALKAGAKDLFSKPFDLAGVLIRAYNMLEVRLLHPETKELCVDRIADNHGFEKIKTIGDAYIAAAGLPVPVPDHTSRGRTWRWTRPRRSTATTSIAATS